MPTTATSNGSIVNGTTHPSKDVAGTKSGDAATAATAVLKPSIPMPSTSTKIRGVDFNEYKTPITVQQLSSHFLQTGFQATNLGKAIEIINNMVTPPPFIRSAREKKKGLWISESGNQEILHLIQTMKTKKHLRQTQNVLYF
jgi:hypothetical protein